MTPYHNFCKPFISYVAFSTDKAEADSLKLKQYTTLSRLVCTQLYVSIVSIKSCIICNLSMIRKAKIYSDNSSLT